ncbi:hypothetical protein SDC9_99004 [bioreactor metagenome]|uniref:Uncharacterized protein n=1 Tax=bioreactor metagenome TaxID=1076179 RepID=A0A645AGV1_9ZZZZ
MDHIAYIRFVDTHPESICSNYDPHLVIYESFLALQPFIAVEARMITDCTYTASADLIANRFNFLASGTVDYARDIRKFFNVVKQIFCLICRMFDLKKEILTVKPRHNRKWRSKFKLVDNVIPNLRSCSRSKRSNNGAMPQRCYSRCYVEIGRAEVMSPLGDTVCFVNYYQGNVQ